MKKLNYVFIAVLVSAGVGFFMRDHEKPLSIVASKMGPTASPVVPFVPMSFKPKSQSSVVVTRAQETPTRRFLRQQAVLMDGVVDNPDMVDRNLKVAAKRLNRAQLKELRDVAVHPQNNFNERFLAVYLLKESNVEAVVFLKDVALTPSAFLDGKFPHSSTGETRSNNETELRLAALHGLEKQLLANPKSPSLDSSFIASLPSAYLRKIGQLVMKSQKTQRPLLEKRLASISNMETSP